MEEIVASAILSIRDELRKIREIKEKEYEIKYGRMDKKLIDEYHKLMNEAIKEEMAELELNKISESSIE